MSGLHTLKRITARARQRVGRGQSSGRGKTSGRGTKGQNARSGRKKRPEWRDIIKKLPKRRGFGKNRGRTVVGNRPRPIVIRLDTLQETFESGAEVTMKSLVEKQLLSQNERQQRVKVVGSGSLSKKLNLKDIPVTESAKVAIENAGGTIA